MTETPDQPLETRNYVAPTEDGAEVVIHDGHPLFQMDLARIILRGRGSTGPMYLHVTHEGYGTQALTWTATVVNATSRSPLSTNFPGYLVPAAWLGAIRDAITKHLGESDQVKALTADRDGWKVSAKDQADAAAEFRAERDVARAEVVGLERTLAAREDHLAQLESLVLPPRWVIPEGMEEAVRRPFDTAILTGEPVQTWRDNLTPATPEHDDSLAGLIGEAVHCYGLDDVLAYLGEKFAAVASSTPGEEPVDNDSGEPPERLTDKHGDVWVQAGAGDGWYQPEDSDTTAFHRLDWIADAWGPITVQADRTETVATGPSGEAPPDDVLKVVDREGDTWTRNTPDSPWEHRQLVRTTTDLLTEFGPVVWTDQ